MSAFLFPGQGSQRRGMGRGLFDQVPEFTSIEHEIDECLGYSLKRRCLEDPDNRLKETQYTQPCLYVVNALHYYIEISQGERPRFLAGHSIGEYNALLAAGAFDLLTGLRLVQKRGELMAQVKNGGMAAVTGLSGDRVADLIRDEGLIGLYVASYNSPSQTVISGPLDDIARARAIFELAGAKMYFPLPVGGAFHSRYLTQVSEAFGLFLDAFSFSGLKVPVISNVTAQPYPSGDPSLTIRTLLVQHIKEPVQWMQSVCYIVNKGETSFKEVGPGTVLTKLVEQIRRQVGSDRWLLPSRLSC